MGYLSTKTYGHEVGLSCCFRQWRATHSHCQYLHGYALAVRMQFTCLNLDERGWVVDFGGLGRVKAYLQETFDHRTVVAADDPQLDLLRECEARGLCQLTVLPRVGCEAFAREIGMQVRRWIDEEGLSRRVELVEVEVREHGANAATWRP